MRQRRSFTIVVGFSFFIVMAAIILTTLVWSTTQKVYAQGESDVGLTQLLTTLWDRTLTERSSPEEGRSEFTFAIELKNATSLFGRSITIGVNLNSQAIESIGADYVCFSRTGGQSNIRSVRCTPFSNIVEVAYQTNQ